MTENLIKKIEREVEEARMQEAPRLKESDFERAAYILDNGTNNFRENFSKLGGIDPEELRVDMIDKMELKKFDMEKRKDDKRLEVPPLYLASLKNIGFIKKVYDAFKTVSWAFRYCNDPDDILNLLIVHKFGYTERYRPLFDKYTLKSIAQYCALKNMQESLESSLKKVEPEI